MQRLTSETRAHLRAQLRSLNVHEKMTVANEHERNYVLDFARRRDMPIFSHKLASGQGIEITRLTLAPIRKCPKCGYQSGAVVQ